MINYITIIIGWFLYLKEKILGLKKDNQIKEQVSEIQSLTEDNIVKDSEITYLKKEKKINEETNKIKNTIKKEKQNSDNIVDKFFKPTETTKLIEPVEPIKANTKTRSIKQKENKIKNQNNDFSIVKKGKDVKQDDTEEFIISI